MSQRVEVRVVQSHKDLMTFIKFPWKIYRDDPHWVPPLLMDRMHTLNRRRNPFFQHNPAIFFLAYQNGAVVGRIAAILNRQHNAYHQDHTGFFGFLEAIHDVSVFSSLLHAAKGWLRQGKMDRIMGPMNPSTNDEIGLLVDGFDSPPFFMMPYNPPYYSKVLQSLGYEKIHDVHAYSLEKDVLLNSQRAQRVSDIVMRNTSVVLREINLKDFHRELEIVREIYNDAWSENWGFIPLTQDECAYIANNLKKIIVPELALIAEYHDEPVGFFVALPNFNEIFIKIRSGKLFPLHWLTFLLNKKNIKGMRALLFGIKRHYQHLGFASVFYIESMRRGLQSGYDHVEVSWVLEDNQTVRRNLRLLGGKAYKTYRIYGMDL